MTYITLGHKISLRIISGSFVFLVWFFLPAVVDLRIAENVTLGTAVVLSALVFFHERWRIIRIERRRE